MRRIITIALLAGLTGCSDSGGAAQSAPPSRTEETAAAELLFGLIDRATNWQAWVQQTSASPAVFEGHGGRGTVTATINKTGKCQYSADLLSKTASETSALHYETNLAGMNPDAVSSDGGVRRLTGGVISCTVVTGPQDACKQIGDGAAPAMLGDAPVAWVKQLATEFKTQYCQ